MSGRLDAAGDMRHLAPPADPLGHHTCGVGFGDGAVSIFGKMRLGVCA